ncbi:hypothetical protein F4824DRAFT_505025 [Ustulina deusta]|nr:hypothetical protein F4824DRAFT_505025 [Ustulina deusta]
MSAEMPVLRSGRVVSPAAAVAEATAAVAGARAALEAAVAAEWEALERGLGGYPLLRASWAVERAYAAVERAKKVRDSAIRRL